MTPGGTRPAAVVVAGGVIAAPITATPTAPPMVRKNDVSEVAEPSMVRKGLKHFNDTWWDPLWTTLASLTQRSRRGGLHRKGSVRLHGQARPEGETGGPGGDRNGSPTAARTLHCGGAA